MSEPMRDDGACLVCWRPGENAHLIDRSLFPDPDSDPRRTIALCREHHEQYDAHQLDLLRYLEPDHRSELARAVEIHGLLGTLERVTGFKWRPIKLRPSEPSSTDMTPSRMYREIGL